ncbi:MAG: hypothetical protein AAGD96_18560, partial [Chloroflexota bacterium]
NLNTQFEVPLNHPDFPDPLILTLSEVNHMGKQAKTEVKGQTHQNTLRDEAFAIVLQGPKSPMLNQGMITLKHPSMGTIEGLFIVPVGDNAAGILYEAVFN